MSVVDLRLIYMLISWLAFGRIRKPISHKSTYGKDLSYAGNAVSQRRGT